MVVLDNMITQVKGGLKIKKMINFKKISAIGASILLTGMTMGVAAAANYPNPFVVGGAADVAIVYGSGEGVNALDVVQSGNVQSNLQSYMGSGSSSTSTSTTGETAALDTSSTRIWLNTSLNIAKTTLTKSDLPTVLADYTFSGNVDAKLTSSVKLVAGAAAGGDNSGKVIFAKQPKSTFDPSVGISIGSSATSNPLYNASVTMSAINFTHAESEGEEIMLFGQGFTISADTSTTALVLLKEAETFSLDSDAPSMEVTIAEALYTVELVSASDTAATIGVTASDGSYESKEVNEADSKKINGIEIGVKTADETNLKLSASVIAGAQKVTLTHGQKVETGSSGDLLPGTLVYITGGTGAATELAITAYRTGGSEDAIVTGESFVDPVFGSFKVDFAGLSSPLDDSAREEIVVSNSGDDDMSLTMTDSDGNVKTFDFAHNASAGKGNNYQLVDWRLADDNNKSIFVYEMAQLQEEEYIVVGNEDYGHLIQLDTISNSTGSDYTKDSVKFEDVMSGDPYTTTFTSEGTGTVSIDGKTYTVTMTGDGEDGKVTLKNPTGDSDNANTFVIYPTIKTSKGAQVALYEPLNISLQNFDNESNTGNDATTLSFPDGDGYTDVVMVFYGDGNWTIGGTAFSTDAGYTVGGSNYTTATIGTLTYNFTAAGFNRTMLYVTDPEGNANIDNPGLIIFEGKDDNSAYEAIVVDLEGNAASMGSSTNGVGVNDVLFSTGYGHYSETLATDSDITQDLDWYGILTTMNAGDSDQKTLTISIPANQVYSQVYIGEEDSSVSAGSTAVSSASLGNVLVKDSEVSSVATKNLIVVGGSCINSAAATLVGGAQCEADWTASTGVGAGEFLIKGYDSSSITSKLALLVAGYNAADTVNAATYLTTQTVDTSSEYKGTSATSAELVVA
jgi:hypothetical protein